MKVVSLILCLFGFSFVKAEQSSSSSSELFKLWKAALNDGQKMEEFLKKLDNRGDRKLQALTGFTGSFLGVPGFRWSSNDCRVRGTIYGAYSGCVTPALSASDSVDLVRNSIMNVKPLNSDPGDHTFSQRNDWTNNSSCTEPPSINSNYFIGSSLRDRYCLDFEKTFLMHSYYQNTDKNFNANFIPKAVYSKEVPYYNYNEYVHPAQQCSNETPPPPLISSNIDLSVDLPSIKVVKNDYNQHFVDTGERPQNFIRDHEASVRFLEYPKLARLIRLKDELYQRRAHTPVHIKADLKNFDWSSLETKFDVILIDPPWREYYERALSLNAVITEDLTPWTFDEMLTYLKIDRIAEIPSFCFLWCGTSHLDEGRALLQAWGFRRCEHICWCKTNNISSKQKINRVDMVDGDELFQRTTEHCLMGVKGIVKRSVDIHFVHSNIDTDVIISEEPVDSQGKPSASTQKPVELHEIIERFCLGRKKIELFGLDRNIRSGWLTIGSEISVSYYNPQRYLSWFVDDKTVDGQYGRYVGTNAKIEQLRPRSPVRGVPRQPNQP